MGSEKYQYLFKCFKAVILKCAISIQQDCYMTSCTIGEFSILEGKPRVFDLVLYDSMQQNEPLQSKTATKLISAKREDLVSLQKSEKAKTDQSVHRASCRFLSVWAQIILLKIETTLHIDVPNYQWYCISCTVFFFFVSKVLSFCTKFCIISYCYLLSVVYICVPNKYRHLNVNSKDVFFLH